MINQYSQDSDAIIQCLNGNIYEIPSAVQEVVIQCAIKCLESRIKLHSHHLNSPRGVCDYLRLQLAQELNEIFAVIFLDNQYRVIAFEKLFQGTINNATVYVRVVLQRALANNAAAVIFSHNHPSGNVEPSNGDRSITRELCETLEMVDVEVLDHIIVSSKSNRSAKHTLKL